MGETFVGDYYFQTNEKHITLNDIEYLIHESYVVNGSGYTFRIEYSNYPELDCAEYIRCKNLYIIGVSSVFELEKSDYFYSLIKTHDRKDLRLQVDGRVFLHDKLLIHYGDKPEYNIPKEILRSIKLKRLLGYEW